MASDPAMLEWKEYNTMNEINTMSDAAKAAAVKRLRSSKIESAYEDFRLGNRDGEHWAAYLATYRQLAALEDITEEFWNRNGKRTSEDCGHDLAWALALRLQLRFGEVYTPSQMKAILFPGPERRRSPEYVAGFVVGPYAMAQAVKSRPSRRRPPTEAVVSKLKGRSS